MIPDEAVPALDKSVEARVTHLPIYRTGGVGLADQAATAHGQRLQSIAGSPPDLSALPPGCAFADRCTFATEACLASQPPVVEPAPGHRIRCLRTDVTAIATATALQPAD